MRRVLLYLWAVVVCVGVGFYLGYQSGIARSPALSSGGSVLAGAAEATTRSRAERAPTRGEPAPRPTSAPESIGPPIRDLNRSQLVDTFYDKRGQDRVHEALDIMAPRGTDVLAVVDGKIQRLFNSKPGWLTIYQFDEQEKFCYYYGHLDGYAADLKEGMRVRKGQLIGYVGSTGNADPNAPHLHFAIFELGPEKKWWEGTPVNPYFPVLRGLE